MEFGEIGKPRSNSSILSYLDQGAGLYLHLRKEVSFKATVSALSFQICFEFKLLVWFHETMVA